jgi:hypothetical protein
MRKLRVVAAVAALALACSHEYGTKVDASQFTPGVTTKDDVIRKYGPPSTTGTDTDKDGKTLTLIAYSHVTSGLGGGSAEGTVFKFGPDGKLIGTFTSQSTPPK